MITQSLLDQCREKPFRLDLNMLQHEIPDDIPYDLIDFCLEHKIGIKIVKMKYDWMLFVVRRYGNARKMRLKSFFHPKDADEFLKWAAVDLYEKG